MYTVHRLKFTNNNGPQLIKLIVNIVFAVNRVHSKHDDTRVYFIHGYPTKHDG